MNETQTLWSIADQLRGAMVEGDTCNEVLFHSAH